MKNKSLSSLFLSLEGILLMGIGIYFIFVRPPLLPGDVRYMRLSLSAIKNSVPDLSVWLQKVFWVMGSYIVTTGLFFLYVAQTSFHTRTNGAFAIVLIAGMTSIGSMAMVNFILQSDFKWILLSFTLPWFIALILYFYHK